MSDQSLADRALQKRPEHPMIQMLERKRNALREFAPNDYDFDQALAIFKSAVARNPKLLGCSSSSVANSVAEAIKLGLVEGGPLGQCYLVPYKGQCTLQLGYRGMVSLAARAGVTVEAGPIYSSDSVEYREGTEPVLRITPPWPIPDDRGDLVGAYAVATFANGIKRAKVIGYNDPETRASRGASKSNGGRNPMKGTPPWEPQWLAKTAIRRLANQIPQSPKLQELTVRATHAEAGIVHPPPQLLPEEDGAYDGDYIQPEGE